MHSLLSSDAAIVVVAGLPGAGKTTLVADLPEALDSDGVRLRLSRTLGWLPYPLWRPLVHAWHWCLLWRALARPAGAVIVRPFTSAWLRRAVLRRARRYHDAVHLVIVDASPALARAGQAVRGRQVREAPMRRHERRWKAARFDEEGWTSITRVSRTEVSVPRSPLRLRSRHGVAA